MSNVLELSRILDISGYYSSGNISDASLPYFNGIVVLDADALASGLRIYYGDEIDLRFWSFLKLNMGSDYVPTTIYTLQEGYKYIYEPVKTKFTIYDKNGTVVFVNNNIHAITDFSIDFTIHKSHQFEIHYASDGKTFYRIATWRKYLHEATPKDFNCGVQNITIPDRVRPYLPDDVDNPSWFIKHLSNLDYYGFFGNNLFDEPDGKPDYPWNPSNPGDGIDGNPMLPRFLAIDAEGFRRLNDIDWSKLRRENNFYVEGMYRLIAENIGLPAYGTLLEYNSFVLALISMGLYPLLNDLQLPESIYNNRPLYEPWLIWKVMDFINTHYSTDVIPEFPIPVFDLSPSYK